MSRSILKGSDANKRMIPIPANEGSNEDYDTLNKVKPWGPVDDEPMMMNDVHREMERIQNDLHKMHGRMMNNFPQMPSQPFDPFAPMIPPPPPQLAPFPFPVMNTPRRALPSSAHAQCNLSMNGHPCNTVALQGSHSPCGTLQKHHGGVVEPLGSGPLVLSPANMGFGPHDMLIPPPPPMPPMTMPPPGPTPIITQDEYGNKNFELVLEIKGFMPEDIHIHTEGTLLQIHAQRLSAKRDLKGEGNVADARLAKECRQQFTLPDVVRAENLRCYVNPKGQLTIDGPLGPDIVRIKNKKKVKFATWNK